MFTFACDHLAALEVGSLLKRHEDLWLNPSINDRDSSCAATFSETLGAKCSDVFL
jgi:hypothetical protein